MSLARALGAGDISPRLSMVVLFVILGALAEILGYAAKYGLKESLGAADLIAPFYIYLAIQMIRTAETITPYFKDLAKYLDTIIHDHAEKQSAAELLRRRLRIWPQVLVSAAGGASVLILTIQAPGEVVRDPVGNAPYLLLLTLACAAAANVGYWIVASLSFFSRLSLFKSICLEDLDRDTLSEGCNNLVICAVRRLAWGLLSVEAGFLLMLGFAPHSEVLASGKKAVFYLCILGLVAVSTLPYVYLRRVRRTSENAKIKKIDDYYDALPLGTEAEMLDRDGERDMRKKQARRSDGGITPAAIATLVAAIMGTTLPPLLYSWLNHLGFF